MKRSRIDRLFRLWDALCWFRHKDYITCKMLMLVSEKSHIRTRNALRRAIFEEYNIEANGIKCTEIVYECIVLTDKYRS